MIASHLTPNGNPQLFQRGEIKQTSMICGYGAREKRLKAQLEEDLKSQYDDSIYDSFIEALDEIAPGLLNLMNRINDLWNPNWDEFKFVMPDGVVITIKPTADEWAEFTIFGKVQITAKVTGVKKTKFSLLLFVSIIHATDAYALRQVIENSDFDIIGIHDGYRSLANNTYKVKQEYNKVLAKINDSRLLEDILQQITGQMVGMLNSGLLSKDILENKYSLS